MAKERGWWNLTCDVEPNDYDLKHIAQCIIEGYTSGEIVETEQDDEKNEEDKENEED